MRYKLELFFSIAVSLLLITVPAGVLAKRPNSTPWSQVISEGKKLIEEKLNLSGVSYKINFVTSNNVTFSAMIASSRSNVQVKEVILLYTLSITFGGSKHIFPVMVAFEKGQSKLLPIGVQAFNGNARSMNNWRSRIGGLKPIIAAQIPSICPNWESMFNWNHMITYSMKMSNIPPQISSRLGSSKEVIKSFEKILNTYSKDWWGAPSPKTVTNTALTLFDWASTKYCENMGGGIPVIFPQQSSGVFSVYVVYRFMNQKGKSLPGWSIDSAAILTKENKPTYVDVDFSGVGPGNVTKLPNPSNLRSSVKQAFFEALQGIVQQIGSAQMLRFYQDLVNNGSAALGTQWYTLYERIQKNQTFEKAIVSIGGKNSAIIAYLTLDIYFAPSGRGLGGYGSFLFVIDDWSPIFPERVVNYGGYEKALEVAKESLGSEANQVISQKIIDEKGILWDNKIYRMYLIKTEVKSGLTSEKVYITEVFLGKAIDTQLFGTVSLSAYQIVMLDWYLIFPPIIGAGCIIGGAAYWIHRKKRRQV